MNTARLVRLPPYDQWDAALVDETLARCPGWIFDPDADSDVGVVIVPGRYDGAEGLTRVAVESLAGAVVFVTGDEEATYVHDKVEHPNLRWWHQLPRPSQHDFARPFGDGAPPHLRGHLRALGPDVERVHDWSFSGQVGHKRRRELVDVLHGMVGGYLNPTPGFTQGLAHDDYARLLASTKVVPCPSGPHTVDTFRAFEALEAGCIPVVDGLCYSYDSRGYWDRLFGETPPFPVVTDSWETFPGILAELLDGWAERAVQVQAWWLQHKRRMAGWLADDLAAVAG